MPRGGGSSRMAWRDTGGRVISDWTEGEFEILCRFMAAPVSVGRLRYKNVQDALTGMLEGRPVVGLHGAFWKDLSCDEFVAHKVQFGGGEVAVVRPHDGANSALVLALKGEGPFENFRMPLERTPATGRIIGQIEAWIDDGCPG